MLQNSVCTFDIFVEEVFATLLSGATLAVPDAATRDNFESLMEFVEKNEITMISGFPYLLSDMNKRNNIPGSIRLLISGGDVLRASYVSHLLDRVEVYNTYGPSETTVCASYYRCNGTTPLEDGTYPIGKPVKGYEIRILDKNSTSVNLGETGEICILGGGVSRGYVGKESNDIFVTTDDGRRMYRSGDLGRFLPDGNIAFLRRKDQQVMILGRRVEPQEVESVLNNCRGVEKAVVCANRDESGLYYLSAYLVPSMKGVRISRLRKCLSKFLPSFMIPEFFVVLSELPLTQNGKVNRRNLPVVLKERAGQWK